MPFGSLWLPVVLSTVGVFVLSSIAWMLLPHHRSDYKKLASEEPVADALRAQSAAAGMYMLPGCKDPGDRKDPAFAEKLKRGPVGVLILMDGPWNMGKMLGLWLVYCFLVSFVTAYVARHTLAAGAAHLDVMRTTASIASLAYVIGPMPASIWGGHPWRVTLKTMGDGVAYALATGAIFACLWPAA